MTEPAPAQISAPNGKSALTDVRRRSVGLLRRAFRTIDLDVVERTGHLTLLSHLGLVLKTLHIDTMLDVGANEGQFASEVRRLGFAGMIHSFEPVKASFAKLSQRAAGDANWQVHNIALSDAAGEAEINVFDQSVFASILPSNRWGSDRFAGMRKSRREIIEVDALDQFAPRHLRLDGRRVFLKMDTQGFDLRVFRGGKTTMKNVQGLLSELSFIPIYGGMPRHAETLAEYEGAGFSVSGMYPVMRNPDMSLIEMDCVMVRRP